MDLHHWGPIVLAFCLIAAAHRGQAQASRTPQDFSFKHSYQGHEKELLEELQEVLEKLQLKKVSTWEKKFNQVPKAYIQFAPQAMETQPSMCSFGNACAIRKGARIGKLCDCPRGSACNAFLLKCL